MESSRHIGKIILVNKKQGETMSIPLMPKSTAVWLVENTA